MRGTGPGGNSCRGLEILLDPAQSKVNDIVRPRHFAYTIVLRNKDALHIAL